MKSTPTIIAPVLNETGQLKTWSNQSGQFYFTSLTFVNGQAGEYMHKDMVQKKFTLGVETEFEHILSENPQFPAKIKPVYEQKGNFSKGGDQSTKGYALRYAVDCWIAGKIEKDAILKLSEYFHEYMEGKPVVQPAASGNATNATQPSQPATPPVEVILSPTGTQSQDALDDLPF